MLKQLGSAAITLLVFAGPNPAANAASLPTASGFAGIMYSYKVDFPEIPSIGDIFIREIGRGVTYPSDLDLPENYVVISLESYAVDGEKRDDIAFGGVFFENRSNKNADLYFEMSASSGARLLRPPYYELDSMSASAMAEWTRDGSVIVKTDLGVDFPAGTCASFGIDCPFFDRDGVFDVGLTYVEEVLKPGETALFEWRMETEAIAAPIPLPASAWLLGSAICAVVAWGRRRGAVS